MPVRVSHHGHMSIKSGYSQPVRASTILYSPVIKSRLVATTLLLAIMPAGVYCAETSTPDAAQQGDTEAPTVGKRFFSIVDKEQSVAVDRLTGLTNRVDSFFSNEKVYNDSTDSVMRIRADTIWNEETNKLGFTGDIRLKLDLKRTSEKYKFVFESDPERTDSEIDQNPQETPLQAAREPSYYAGFETHSGRKEKWLYRTALGVRIKAPLDVFIRSRASRTYLLDKWSMRLDEGLFYFDSFGLGADSAVEFDHALDFNSLFRSRSYLRWLNQDDNFYMSEVVSLFHTLDKHHWLGYQAGVYGNSRPVVAVSDYLLLLRYRQDIHRQFLFFEIIPQIRYQKINHFEAEHSVIFRLEWFIR